MKSHAQRHTEPTPVPGSLDSSASAPAPGQLHVPIYTDTSSYVNQITVPFTSHLHVTSQSTFTFLVALELHKGKRGVTTARSQQTGTLMLRKACDLLGSHRAGTSGSKHHVPPTRP